MKVKADIAIRTVGHLKSRAQNIFTFISQKYLLSCTRRLSRAFFSVTDLNDSSVNDQVSYTLSAHYGCPYGLICACGLH